MMGGWPKRRRAAALQGVAFTPDFMSLQPYLLTLLNLQRYPSECCLAVSQEAAYSSSLKSLLVS